MSSSWRNPFQWNVLLFLRPHQLLLLTLISLCSLTPASGLCRVTGGVLGIHWSSVVGLGWRPLAMGPGGPQCWESCCLEPACSAVWTLGGRCVLLSCSRPTGCSITSLPQPHQESLGLLQLLSKSPARRHRRPRRATAHKGTRTVSQQHVSSGQTALSQVPVTPANGVTLAQAANRSLEQPTNGSETTMPSPPIQQNSSSSSEVTTAVAPSSSNASVPSSSHKVQPTPAPTQAVRELVVSAGNSVEVTLPRSEVELNAFVVPAPPAGTSYSFDWRLKTHPKDYSGEMEGKRSKTLKLSKVLPHSSSSTTLKQ